jgi:hypothetical protein
MKKLYTATAALLLIIIGASAQVGQGGIKGQIKDTETGDALPFVNVVVEQGGVQVAGGSTDFDGKYFIKPIPPGKYDIKVKFVGYKPVMITGIVVNSDRISFKDINMESTAIEITTFEVIEYTVPLISKDNTTQGQTLTADDLDKMPARSVSGIAELTGGVTSKDDGSGNLNFRGQRDDANYVFIDGIKVRAGANSLPRQSIEQISVMVGGIPAQYGDVTGGVTSITTRGASREYHGSVEYVTSGYKLKEKTYGLDPYAYNLLEVSANGPLLWKKDSAGGKKEPLIGFFIAGNFSSTADPRPSHNGNWKIKDEAYDRITSNPYSFNPDPTQTGVIKNSELLRMNDLENVRAKPNASQFGFNVTPKLDFNIIKNGNLTLGGAYGYNKRNLSSYSDGTGTGSNYPRSLMNYQNNPEQITHNSRAFIRFTQRFNEGGESKSSTLKNAFYSLQFDYTNDRDRIHDPEHKDKLFDYGYIGEFKTYKAPVYEFGTDSATGRLGWVLTNIQDTLVGFRPGSLNPVATRYTEQYYALYGWQGYDSDGNPVFDRTLAQDPNDPTRVNKFLSDRTAMQTNLALFNGDSPLEAYNIWESPGESGNRFLKQVQNQYRVSAQGSADIGDHAISMGFEFEQRVDRAYAVTPNATGSGRSVNNLWGLARSYTNNHILELDKKNPIIDTFPDLPGAEAFTYPRLNAAPGAYTSEDAQKFFDYNLRNSLGLDPDGTDFIDLDALRPEDLKMTFFSADELLNNGNSPVSYYGYDPYGEKLGSDPTLDDFFTQRDEFGNYTRPIGAFRPIYVAGYVQDKFAFRDLVFNVGVRVDRYDANQKVLKDPYVLFPTIKAGESEALKLSDGKLPENIGEDYVVYVDDVKDPTRVVGYRNGSTWYNEEGAEISDPDQLATATGRVAPLLVDKNLTQALEHGIDAYEDYKPQVNVMPRIAFSFPISDEALFFAHYDILTRRPTGVSRLDPTDYLYLESTTNTRNNPNLKPERTIDYEVGFQQKLTNSSSVKVSGFYREFRDQVQLVRRLQAFPREYNTYENIDFGNVKGVTIGYDLRRTGNISLKANYTLQFAEGTGSNQSTAFSLINARKDNLRVTSPFDFDQRHRFQVIFDFRYGEGKEYNGPVIKDIKILENVGFNVNSILNSGTPFSAQTLSSGTGFTQDVGQVFLEGAINGNRLPWSYRMDLRIDKDFKLKVSEKKKLNMTCYLQVLNLLNNINIISVYRFTGNPDDDGYLGDARWANDIQNQVDPQSFTELYNIKQANPANLNLPRRIRLGLMMSF